jgi:hypothetical protein
MPGSLQAGQHCCSSLCPDCASRCPPLSQSQQRDSQPHSTRQPAQQQTCCWLQHTWFSGCLVQQCLLRWSKHKRKIHTPLFLLTLTTLRSCMVPRAKHLEEEAAHPHSAAGHTYWWTWHECLKMLHIWCGVVWCAEVQDSCLVAEGLVTNGCEHGVAGCREQGDELPACRKHKHRNHTSAVASP